MALIQVNIVHSSSRSHPKGLMLTVAWNYPYFLGIIRGLIKFNAQSRRLALVAFVFMITLFKEKPIEHQIREFNQSKYGVRSQSVYIEEYRRFSRIRCISEMTYESIQAFRQHKKSTSTAYTSISIMQALRSFVRYHRRLTELKPHFITNDGVFTPVGENAIIEPMKAKIQKVKIGRPRDKEAIKKVRLLKDKGGLSFRQISVVMKKDVKTVHQWYKFSFEDELLAK